MLTQFNIERAFNNIDVRMHVDCRRREASLTVSVNGRLVVVDAAVHHYDEVCTPDVAERWLSRPMGETGNFLETLWYVHGRSEPPRRRSPRSRRY